MTNISNIVQQVLRVIEYIPHIAYFLAQPNKEELATKILSAIKGITKKDNHQEAVDILLSNHEMVIKLQNFIIELHKEIYAIEHKDFHSARVRDVHLSKMGQNNFRANIMVLAAVIGLVSCLILMCIYKEKLSGEAIGIISTVCGIFGSCLKDAYSFEFGSSRGSKEKYAHLLSRPGIK